MKYANYYTRFCLVPCLLPLFQSTWQQVVISTIVASAKWDREAPSLSKKCFTFVGKKSDHEATLATSSTCTAGTSTRIQRKVAELTLSRYIKCQNVTAYSKFHVQGWRWHTMSFILETKRLHSFTQTEIPYSFLTKPNQSSSDANTVLQSLKKITEYVIGFNMKGLHKIEKELFFPWLRSHLGKKHSSIKKIDIRQSFNVVMDEIEKETKSVSVLGAEILKVVQSTDAAFHRMNKNGYASSETCIATLILNASKQISRSAAKMIELAESIQQKEENLLIPLVQLHISDPEQKSFNNRVLRSLGIVDSRLHLVGMYEAIYGHDAKRDMDHEKKIFEESIPAIPRMMIPRWKRLLYDPRIAALNVLQT